VGDTGDAGKTSESGKVCPVHVPPPGASYIAQGGGRPVYENGEWGWQPLTDMFLDEAGVELFKTSFYKNLSHKYEPH
jgi:hypothetical protein